MVQCALDFQSEISFFHVIVKWRSDQFYGCS